MLIWGIRPTAAAFAAAWAFAYAPAYAAGLDAAELLNDFNAIVLGDVDVGTQHIDGRVYVGGNLTGNNGSVYLHGGSAPASSYASLYVVGDVTGKVKAENGSTTQVGGSVSGMNFENASNATIAVGKSMSGVKFGNNNSVWVGGNASGVTMQNGGSIEVGGNLSNSNFSNARIGLAGSRSNTNANNGSTVTTGPISDSPLAIPSLAEMRDLFTATSERLAGMAQTSTMSTYDSNTTFDATVDGGISVFNISGDQFNALQNITFTLDPDQTIVINVFSDGMDLATRNDGNMGSGSVASQVLWNFINTKSLYTANALVGAVLAPTADVRNNSSNEGTVVAKSLTLGNGEWHQQGWTGDLPEPTPVANTPIPGALPLMAGGLGALAVIGRRRRRLA